MPKKVTEEAIKLHLQTLTETPPLILNCTKGMDETQLIAPLAPGEWSMVEIMAHLRACSDVWSYSIYAMYTLDNPQLAFIHPRDWAKKLGYAKLTFAENFMAYEVGRMNLLRILNGLKLEDWDRSAMFIGKANTFTIFGETMRMALHEDDHSQQLKTMFLSGGG